MARLFGFISNRTDLGPRLLKAKAPFLKEVREPGQSLGWGVGFFQGGELLLRRRPIDERTEVDPGRFGDNLKSELAIGHIRLPTVGNLRTENTHPFRYRHWLFAHVGTALPDDGARAALMESLPDFLRANVRGDTDSELLFNLVLARLHQAGHLEHAHCPPQALREALRAALEQLDKGAAVVGATMPPNDLLMTDGEHLVGVNQSGAMATCTVNSTEACSELLGASLNPIPRSHLERAQCSLVASPLSPDLAREAGFRSVPSGTFLTLTRTTLPDFEAI